MTAHAPAAPVDAPRWPALIPPLLIAIPVGLKLIGVPIANPWIIFALLFGLMLTGMPISISLGLTVLTYLFTMTTITSSRPQTLSRNARQRSGHEAFGWRG